MVNAEKAREPNVFATETPVPYCDDSTRSESEKNWVPRAAEYSSPVTLIKYSS
jgi:hypothetical protein